MRSRLVLTKIYNSVMGEISEEYHVVWSVSSLTSERGGAHCTDYVLLPVISCSDLSLATYSDKAYQLYS